MGKEAVRGRGNLRGNGDNPTTKLFINGVGETGEKALGRDEKGKGKGNVLCMSRGSKTQKKLPISCRVMDELINLRPTRPY